MNQRRRINTRARVGAHIPIRRVIVIVCEGEKTERIYFKQFRIRGSEVEVRVPSVGETDPVGLVESAIKQKDLIAYDPSRGDEIWCVYDCDEHTDQELKKALKLASKNSVNIAFSNPAFELWYLLHYGYYSDEMSRGLAYERLRRHIPNYDKNVRINEILDPRVGQALGNAQRLKEYHLGQGHQLNLREANPLTDVDRLVQLLRRIVLPLE